MKGKPNERGQTDDSPNLIEKPVAKAWFACKYATRVPSYGTGVQGHTKKEGLPAMTKHPGTPKEEGEERKKRRKERERERKGEERKEKGRCSQLRTVVQGRTKERKGKS